VKTASGLAGWPTKDPIGELGGVNLYAMVGNDAVNWLDLFGLDEYAKAKDKVARLEQVRDNPNADMSSAEKEELTISIQRLKDIVETADLWCKCLMFKFYWRRFEELKMPSDPIPMEPGQKQPSARRNAGWALFVEASIKNTPECSRVSIPTGSSKVSVVVTAKYKSRQFDTGSRSGDFTCDDPKNPWAGESGKCRRCIKGEEEEITSNRMEINVEIGPAGARKVITWPVTTFGD